MNIQKIAESSYDMIVRGYKSIGIKPVAFEALDESGRDHLITVVRHFVDTPGLSVQEAMEQIDGESFDTAPMKLKIYYTRIRARVEFARAYKQNTACASENGVETVVGGPAMPSTSAQEPAGATLLPSDCPNQPLDPSEPVTPQILESCDPAKFAVGQDVYVKNWEWGAGQIVEVFADWSLKRVLYAVEMVKQGQTHHFYENELEPLNPTE